MRYLAYVSGKYSGETENSVIAHIEIARQHSIDLWENGFACITPHLNTARMELDCKAKYEDFMEGDFRMIQGVDFLYMLPGWEESSGATREKQYAESLGIPIIYSLEEAIEFRKKDDAVLRRLRYLDGR